MARFESENKIDPGMMSMATMSPAREAPIASLLAQQYDELMKLREMIGMLSDRIAPALGPERPTDGEGCADSSPERSEVARIIDDHTDNIRRISWNVQRLIERVEL